MLLLTRGNRWNIIAVVLAVIFCLLVILSQLGLAPIRRVAATQNGLRYLFSAFIGAIITGTSVVVTINQLVLSQELGAIGDQRTRMQESMTFQRDVESVLDIGISPPEPAAFLSELVDAIQSRANQLAETADARDTDLEKQVEDFSEEVTRNADEVTTTLETAQFGTFDVIWAALAFNYSWKVHTARKIRDQHSGSLSDAATETLDELLELLKFFGEAREHFKTLYFQWELINLSRALLYIAIPALVVMAGLILYVDNTTLAGTTLGVDNLVWVASAGFTIGIAPFVVFTVFIMRIITVAKRTLAMGPFILRETNKEYDVE
jgi:hypothetical protein